MEITSASNDDVLSYTAQIDSEPVLTIYGQASVSGGNYEVKNRRVGILTTDPLTTLEIKGIITETMGEVHLN